MIALTPRRRVLLGVCLTLLPVIGQFAVVHYFGVNSVAADEVAYMPFVRHVRDGSGWIPMLWHQHNEHRVIPMKLAIAAIAQFASWNIKAEMYVSAVLAALLVFALWRIYRSIGGTDLLRFAPVPALVCSLAQYQNMLYGMQMCQYFTMAGVGGAIAFLALPTTAAVIAAIVCGLIASFSVLNGLLVWPVGQLMLFALRARKSHQLLWGIAGIASVAAYFWRYEPPAAFDALPMRVSTLWRSVKYAMLILGSPLHGGSVFWARAVGIMVALAVLAAAITWLRSRERLRLDAAPAALIAYGVGSCAMIGLGRTTVFTGLITPTYVGHALFATVGLYLIWSADIDRDHAEGPRRSLWVASLGLLLPGLIAANIQGLYDAALWRSALLGHHVILRNFDVVSDELLSRPAVFYNRDVRYLRQELPYLRDHRLADFADPELVLAQEPERRLNTPEILIGSPVEEQLPCPVGTMHDLALQVARTEIPPNASVVSLTVWSGDQLLGKRDVGSELLGDGWIQVPLQKPVRDCLGRPLRIRIESNDNQPGGGAVAATYPHYYRGVLSVPGWPSAPERSLAINVNAYKLRMMK